MRYTNPHLTFDKNNSNFVSAAFRDLIYPFVEFLFNVINSFAS